MSTTYERDLFPEIPDEYVLGNENLRWKSLNDILLPLKENEGDKFALLSDLGAATWGDITGNITNQTDLIDILNDKADITSISAVGFSGLFSDLLEVPNFVSSVNSLFGDISIVGGSNVTVTSEAGIITISATGGGEGGDVPEGGNTGQVLAKASNADFDLEWIDQTGGGGGDVSSVFGRTGDVVAEAGDYTWNLIDKTESNIADITLRSHTSLTDIGTFTHSQIDSHISNTSNPHNVTTGQIGAVATTGDQTISGVKTFSSLPISSETPTLSSHFTTKIYVDALVTSGARFVSSVRVATTGNLTGTSYNNGASGVGATITRTTNSVFTTIDGIAGGAFVVGDYVLVKNQTNPAHNGVYQITQVGEAGVSPGIMTRVAIYDSSSEIVEGTFFNVLQGTTNSNTQWRLTTTGAVTVGTTGLVFEQSSQIPNITASNGVIISGNDVRIGTGTISSAVTWTMQNSNFIIDLQGTGDVIFRDAGVNMFQLLDTGRTIVGSGTALGQLTVRPSDSSIVGLAIRGIENQTANLLLIENVDGGDLFAISSQGNQISSIKVDSTSTHALLSQTAIIHQQNANTGTAFDLTTQYAAVKFTANSDYFISTIGAFLRREGTFTNPTATMTGYLYSDNDGEPGSILSTGQAIRIGSLSTGANGSKQQFGNINYTVSNGTDYWIVFRFNSLPSGATVQWMGDTTGTAIFATSTNGTTWNPENDISPRWTAEGRTGIGLDVVSPNNIAGRFNSINTNAISATSINGTALVASSANGIGATFTSTYGAGATFTSTHGNGIIVTTSSGIAGAFVGATGTGLNATTQSGIGAVFTSTTGTSMTATTTSGIGGIITANPATNNEVHEMWRMTRNTTGTAAVGIGSRMNFYLERASGSSQRFGSIDHIATNVTTGQEASDFVFSTRLNGTVAERFWMRSTGVFQATNARFTAIAAPTSQTYAVTVSDDGSLSSAEFPAVVSFGTEGQIPFMNSTDDDFSYSSNFTYDGTNLNITGDIVVSNDIQMALGGIINFDDGDMSITHSEGLLTVAGGEISMSSNKIIDLANPTSANDAVNKGYVDNLLEGLRWKQSVRVATTGNITLSGEQTIDGISVIAGERVLVKNQSTATENGVYVVASGAWARSADASTGAEIVGMAVNANEGTANADRMFVNTNDSITLGSTNIVFVDLGSTIAHNNTTGLQGGTVNEYYHLTSAQHSALHAAVTLAGQNYLSLSGQQITANQINLASHVTGTLPVGNGGTGQSTLTANKVLVGNGTSGIFSPTNLHWDGNNLGIGLTTLTYKLDVYREFDDDNMYGIRSVVTGTDSVFMNYEAIAGRFVSNFNDSSKSIGVYGEATGSLVTNYAGFFADGMVGIENKLRIGAGETDLTNGILRQLEFTDSGLGLERIASNTLGFYASNTEIMRMTSDGLAIGTTSVNARLNVFRSESITTAGQRVVEQISGNFSGAGHASASLYGRRNVIESVPSTISRILLDESYFVPNDVFQVVNITGLNTVINLEEATATVSGSIIGHNISMGFVKDGSVGLNIYMEDASNVFAIRALGGYTFFNQKMEIESGLNDSLLLLDQNHASREFLALEGTFSSENPFSVSCNINSYDVQGGSWTPAGHYKQRINGTEYWIRYYRYTGAECPRIDAFIDGEWQEVGRAIYKLNSEEKRGVWKIILQKKARKFRLVEDEPETSYIDYIKGDGVVGLEDIVTSPASKFGADDGSIHSFEFDEPVEILETKGYYVYNNSIKS